MKEEIPVLVEGSVAYFPRNTIETALTVIETVTVRKYRKVNINKPQLIDQKDHVHRLYVESDKFPDLLQTGLGAILFLQHHSDKYQFTFKNLNEVGKLKELKIPQRILKDKKFKVRGKDRQYYYDCLKICYNLNFGCVKLPTGSGKTVIQLTLAENYLKSLGAGLIIVPTHIILSQFMDSAERFNLSAKRFTEERDFDEKMFYLTTPQILYNDVIKRKKPILEKVKWILIDECHHTRSHTWFSLLEKAKNVQKLQGFSALPFNPDSMKYTEISQFEISDAKNITFLGPIVFHKTFYELQDFLNIPQILNVRYTWKNVKSTNNIHVINKYCENEKARNQLIADVLNLFSSLGLRTIFFVVKRAHGENILRLCNNKTVVWYGGGYIKDKHEVPYSKEDFLDAMNSGHLTTAIATTHAVEGTDLETPLNAIVLAQHRSHRIILQSAGRVVRPSNLPSFIVNIYDEGLGVLKNQANARAGIFQSEFRSSITTLNNFEEVKKLVHLSMEQHKRFQETTVTVDDVLNSQTGETK